MIADKPLTTVEVFIVQAGSNSTYAFQQTGENGKVTFSNLPRGLYRVIIIIPQQSGKFMRGKNDVNSKLMVGYHNDKQEYFLREDEGFFTVNFSRLR